MSEERPGTLVFAHQGLIDSDDQGSLACHGQDVVDNTFGLEVLDARLHVLKKGLPITGLAQIVHEAARQVSSSFECEREGGRHLEVMHQSGTE